MGATNGRGEAQESNEVTLRSGKAFKKKDEQFDVIGKKGI